MKKIRNLSVIMLAAVLVGCASQPKTPATKAAEYRQVRPERKGPGPISNPALYERADDPYHVYIRALDGNGWIPMPK